MRSKALERSTNQVTVFIVNLAELIVVFIMSTWLFFMMSLPIGNKVSGKTKKGHASSAPDNPNIAIKFAISALLGTLITIFCNYFIA